MGLGENGGFRPTGLAHHGWATTQPIRDVFHRAFEASGLPYYNPHSFRDMLVRYAMTLDLTPEQMKAWSQNLGHSDVLTTFTSYGQVPVHRQGDLIRRQVLRASTGASADHVAALEAIVAALKANPG
jgi:integrase